MQQVHCSAARAITHAHMYMSWLVSDLLMQRLDVKEDQAFGDDDCGGHGYRSSGLDHLLCQLPCVV